jgi:hypothetical protein
MAIFPKLEIEPKIQVGEKTRINATKSYKTQGEAATTLVRIRPDSAVATWFTVADVLDASTYWLDWEYAAAGTFVCQVEITTNSVAVVSSSTIEVVTSVTEHLFSSDADIYTQEPDLMKFIKDGKSGYNDFHRLAQASIMDEIYRARLFNSSGGKLVVADVLDVSELTPWSVNMVLKNIFQALSNKTDDIFSVKAKIYGGKETEDRNRAMNQMRLDYNKDGILANTEAIDMRSIELVRR